MAKDQFQSTEELHIHVGPFISKVDGSEITDDSVTLTVKAPDGTVLTYSLTRPTDVDADTGYWKKELTTTVYNDHGTGVLKEWLTKAISSNSNAMVQRKIYFWGDYTDDITTGKAAAVAAQAAAESADGKCTTIEAVTSALPTFPSDPADESALEAVISALQGDVTAVKAVTDVLPVFPSDPADESALEAVIAAVQGDVTAIKAKTDVPTALADQTTLSSVASNVNTIKTGVAQLQTIAKGHWKVVGYQLLLYDEMDAVIVRFNLYDDVGAPTNSRIFERVPV